MVSTNRGQAGPPFNSALGDHCGNHLVRPEAASPHSRVSSTCLDPADIEHKFTKGRMGWEVDSEAWVQGEEPACNGPLSSVGLDGRQCPRHQTPPNPEGKHAWWRAGPQDHHHTLTHRLGSLRPPT